MSPAEITAEILTHMDHMLPVDPATAVEVMRSVIDGLTERIERIEEDLA